MPGIEPSEDRLLQGRLFSYPDTQFHRLGANFQQIPVNRPRADVANYNQDGDGNQKQHSSDVNYQPSVTAGALVEDKQFKYIETALSGTTQQHRIAKNDNFEQAGDFYRALSKQDQDNLISNLAGDLGSVRNTQVKEAMLSHFYKADADYGTRLTAAIKGDLANVKALASKLSDN